MIVNRIQDTCIMNDKPKSTGSSTSLLTRNYYTNVMYMYMYVLIAIGNIHWVILLIFHHFITQQIKSHNKVLQIFENFSIIRHCNLKIKFISIRLFKCALFDFANCNVLQSLLFGQQLELGLGGKTPV